MHCTCRTILAVLGLLLASFTYMNRHCLNCSLETFRMFKHTHRHRVQYAKPPWHSHFLSSGQSSALSPNHTTNNIPNYHNYTSKDVVIIFFFLWQVLCEGMTRRSTLSHQLSEADQLDGRTSRNVGSPGIFEKVTSFARTLEELTILLLNLILIFIYENISMGSFHNSTRILIEIISNLIRSTLKIV